MWKIVQAAGAFHSWGWQINRLLSVVKKEPVRFKLSTDFQRVRLLRGTRGLVRQVTAPCAAGWGTGTAPDWEKKYLYSSSMHLTPGWRSGIKPSWPGEDFTGRPEQPHSKFGIISTNRLLHLVWWLWNDAVEKASKLTRCLTREGELWTERVLTFFLSSSY